jgi:hypothetical protein
LGFPYIAAKIYQTLGEAFGYTFVAGRGSVGRSRTLGRRGAAVESDRRAPDDDWPYLYLKGRRVPAHYVVALAYNLLGAIVGGALEYSSMAIGINGLYLLAGLVYFEAFLAARRGSYQTSSHRIGILPN